MIHEVVAIVCPGCGKRTMVNSDGTMRRHRVPGAKTHCGWQESNPRGARLAVLLNNASAAMQGVEHWLQQAEQELGSDPRTEHAAFELSAARVRVAEAVRSAQQQINLEENVAKRDRARKLATERIHAWLRWVDVRTPLDRISAKAVVESHRSTAAADDDGGELVMSAAYEDAVAKLLPLLVEARKEELSVKANGFVATIGEIGKNFRYKHFETREEAESHLDEWRRSGAEGAENASVKPLRDVMWTVGSNGTNVFWRHIPVD